MWYFAWILGALLASAAGVVNALWHELHMPDEPLGE
jgi:cytochrome bd-I ubiquinol oxidase subunit X